MSAPLKISLKEIKSITNNFDKANFIGEGFLGEIYKGRLSLSGELADVSVRGLDNSSGLQELVDVDVAIRRLDNSFRLQELAFEKEISILSRHKHKNMVSLVGFCYEDNEMLIINERVARGSLRRRLSDRELTWTRRLQISVGAVRALSYLHKFNIIHHNINTNTILVDEKWEAKISGFEYSMTIPARDLDLAYEKLGIGVYKSDVYSIGVVLFELLCGKKAFTSEDNSGFQASIAMFNYENRTLNKLVDPDLFSQMNPLSFKIFSDTAYSCLNNQRSPPTMDEVLKRLERALKVQQMRDNNEHSAVPVERTIPDHLNLKLKSIEHMRIPLADILSATGNFTKGGIVSAGGFGSVYQAELEHVDKAYCMATEWKINDREVPKKRSKVAIKRITDTEDEIAQQGFYAEIKMLMSCKHSNIITLLGFCDERGEMILIYEYASNGSLNYHLQNKSVNHNDSWAQRVKICLDAAKGLSFLHTTEWDRREIVHRDIKSANILLDENFEAKIGDFGLSLFQSVGKQHNTRYTREVAGTMAYMDPQYYKDAKLIKELDVYSFGVVLFEILCGAVTYHRKYVENNKRGLAFIARQHFEKGTINEIVDPKIKEEINESLLTSIIGHDQKSLDTFSKIAYKCLAEAQEDRPTMKVVVEELEKALFFQTNRVKKVQLHEIIVATNDFSDENLIQEVGLGNLYKGTLFQSGKLMDIVARRFNRKHGQGDVEFQTEISMLSSLTLKHKNIISIFGAVDEKDEKIVIYDLASLGTLHQHLIGPTDLDASRRLQICLGVARALSHIHSDVIHCDINNSKIFLDKDWEPKIFGFEFATTYPQSWRHRLLYSRHFYGTRMTPKFDVHCFGVFMLEILCGRKPTFKEDGAVGKVDEIVNLDVRKQMDRNSFKSFLTIAKSCLNKDPLKRPTMDQIIQNLWEVLEPDQQKRKNLEHSTADEEEDASTKRLNVLDFLKISRREIKEATLGDRRPYVGTNMYRAELNILDFQSMSSMGFIDQLPKTRKTVTIKPTFTRQYEDDKQGFLREFGLLIRRKHPNIASLCGFCAEHGETHFVFDVAIGGSLSDYFQNKFTDNLTWAQRIQISLDIAHGIHYLHTSMEGMLHGDLRSENILLDENLNAKVTGFGLYKFRPKESTIRTEYNADSQVYLDDPKSFETGTYKKESDVYSFGVVLFEIVSWRLAYDKIYMMENNAGLAPIARQRFKEGGLKELIDPKIIEDDGHIFTINRGPNQESFDAFSKIAYQCLAENHAKRPTMEVVIKELKNALELQGEAIELIRFKPSDILLATQNFSESFCIGVYECGKVYNAELDFGHGRSLVAVKRISGGEGGQGEQRFISEIEMHIRYNHPNVVSILGFCDEHDEKILVYKHTSNNSLDDYLKSDNIINLTWTQRLHLCLGIARGLNHIHTKMDPRQHGDIRSANVMLDNNLEAKVAYFGIPKLHLPNQEVGLKVYQDPENEQAGKLEKESDVYSFGVVMFEIFCGRVAYDPVYMDKNEKGLASVALRCVNDGTIKKLIDPNLMEEADKGTFTSSRRPNQDSLDTYLGIAYKCLGETRATRPTLKIVIKELERAINFQVGEWN